MESNSFVVFDKTTCTEMDYIRYFEPIFGERVFVFLGEIKQCTGHCILADLSTGKIIGMYHTDNFREATEDEI
jgi:hypothetical protein